MNDIQKGIIHNAKGDFLNITTIQADKFTISPSTATASVTFYADGRYQVIGGLGAGWFQWAEVPYTGDLDGTPTAYTPDPSWIGASNYRISWTTPNTTGPGGAPDTYSPLTSSPNTTVDKQFIASQTSVGNGLVYWSVTLTNLATTATDTFTVDLEVTMEP